jgi:hypothetical protein
MFFLLFCFASVASSAQDDIRRAYENIWDMSKEEIKKTFDLDRPEVSEFLLRKMNTYPQKGGIKRNNGAILKANPRKGIEWLLKIHKRLLPIGRANMALSLRRIDCVESYEILFRLLDDKKVVVINKNAGLAPICPGKSYLHLRVCDCAYNSLLYLLKEKNKVPLNNLPLRFMWYDESIEFRDRAIKGLLDWKKKELKQFLRKKKSIISPPLKEEIKKIGDAINNR